MSPEEKQILNLKIIDSQLAMHQHILEVAVATEPWWRRIIKSKLGTELSGVKIQRADIAEVFVILNQTEGL